MFSVQFEHCCQMLSQTHHVTSLRLLLGTEAPVMMPNFSFFSHQLTKSTPQNCLAVELAVQPLYLPESKQHG